MPSKKHTVAVRISEETYQSMLELVKGDNAKYETMSEYMYTLIISDIARRKAQKPDMADIFMDALNRPEVIEKLRSILNR